jgi:hypothetical protein
VTFSRIHIVAIHCDVEAVHGAADGELSATVAAGQSCTATHLLTDAARACVHGTYAVARCADSTHGHTLAPPFVNASWPKCVDSSGGLEALTHNHSLHQSITATVAIGAVLEQVFEAIAVTLNIQLYACMQWCVSTVSTFVPSTIGQPLCSVRPSSVIPVALSKYEKNTACPLSQC